ncbi:hypothetical protein BDV10DRAFT_190075 [Aspergillus recurvatus]
MSSEDKTPHIPARGVIAPSVDVDSITGAVKHIISLASSSETRIVSVIVDEINHLRGHVKEKEDELTKLRNMVRQQEEHKTIAVNEMFSVMETEKARAGQLDAKIGSLQESMTKKDKDLKEKDEQVKTLKQETKNTDLEKALASASAGIARAQSQLQKLESFRISLAELDETSMMREFSGLWDYATAEMSAVLAQDIHSAALKDKPRWERFRKATETALSLQVPLLASNTQAAKGMRLAVILGILSREIDRYIFQPNYLISEEARLRDILSQLALTDGAKESFCRAVLLSIDQGTQQESLNSRVQSLVRKVSFCMCDLLSEAQYNEFRQHIENVVSRAISVWLPIQRAAKRYEPDFDPLHWDDGEWRPFKLPGQETSLSKQDDGISSNNLLTIFPRISCVHDHGRDPLTYVIQFRKSHQLYIDAEREITRQPTSPTASRRPSTGTRKQSLAADTSRPRGNNGSFLEGAGTSA